MNAKLKAKELVRKYWDLGGIDVLEAKQCALIAVNLAIEVETNIFKAKVQKTYWQEVKQEIKKL